MLTTHGKVTQARLYSVICAAWLLILMAAGCTVSRYIQLNSQLNQNRQEWTAQNITNYRYTLKIAAFGPPDITTPVAIEVTNGIATSIKYQGGEQMPIMAINDIFKSADTVDKLFVIVMNAISKKPDEIIVDYDATLGYPKKIRIGPLEYVPDAGIVYFVSDFKVLEDSTSK